MSTDRVNAIGVDVGPGGTLRALTLTDRSLRLGREELAEAILGLIGKATARANQRARLELRGKVGDAELDLLGLTVPPELVEVVESTTPDTWRV